MRNFDCFILSKFASFLSSYLSFSTIIHLSVHLTVPENNDEIFEFLDYSLLINTILFYFYKIFQADFNFH